MKILVLVKAVRTDLVFDDIADREHFTINPYDLFALQHVLSLKREDDHITCISMGHSGARMILEKCIALGVDDVLWLNDNCFAGADTIATSYALAFMISKGRYDLVVCGEKAVDGETAQVPAGVAERLSLAHLSGVTEIMQLEHDTIVLSRQTEHYSETLKVTLPAVLSINKFTTVMNTISMKDMRRAHHVDMLPIKAADTGMDLTLCGTRGSKTKVLQTNTAVTIQGNNVIFEDMQSFLECISKSIKPYV